jgi:hypothetical protein
MILAIETEVSSGNYQIIITANGGTASIEISADGQPFQQIPDASWSANAVAQMGVSKSTLRPVLTGGAVISITPIRTPVS